MTRRDMQNVYNDFGVYVLTERNRVGISQEKLAKRIGLSRTSVVNIEAGRQRVLLHTAVSIARALGVPLRRLLP